MATEQKARVIGGRFRILKTLGSGGMGDVYLAQDQKLPRKVAIKSIRPDLSKNVEVRKRLSRESQLHAKIGSHQHIVTLYDQIEEDGQIHLVMEYVEGECLQDVLDRYAKEQRGLGIRDTIVLIDQTLQALSCIHQNGIVHRDIKPGNILLTKNHGDGSSAKLMDFGIARQEIEEAGATMLTQENTSSPGTPLYMAPEQIDQTTYGGVTAATDLYAVGVMFYQMLSGAPPFQGSLTQIYSGHLSLQPPEINVTGDATISDDVKEVITRALAKHPNDRFASAAEFRAALAKTASDVAHAGSATISVQAPAATDSNRTLLAHEAQQTAFNPGQTVLSGNTRTGGSGNGAKTAVLIGIVLGVIAAAGTAGYFALRPAPATPADPIPEEAVSDAVPEAPNVDPWETLEPLPPVQETIAAPVPRPEMPSGPSTLEILNAERAASIEEARAAEEAEAKARAIREAEERAAREAQAAAEAAAKAKKDAEAKAAAEAQNQSGSGGFNVTPRPRTRQN